MVDQVPNIGDVVQVRSRQYLVERTVKRPTGPGQCTLVELSCLDDDAQGEPLAVLWEREIDARVLGDRAWSTLGAKGFDPPDRFAAYLNVLRWNSVTSTNPDLFQSPYRAGVQIKDYQLEPLRKALHLPRVNLFIADDVGLGKTIEAGLILREMLLRQRVDRVVIVAPPSVTRQWRDEMLERFGLDFVVMDREFVLEQRRQRGITHNPWASHSRFILSNALLRDPQYSEPLADWLGVFAPRSLLILDEAHHAAPASGAAYAIDSELTRATRSLAPRFEHRLFLSATPHNGHSNSFSALLEILDPQRFCRGVPVQPSQLDAVLVRRLKEDLRGISGDFPHRRVIQIDLDHLPADAPELTLASLLDRYAAMREDRLSNARKSVQAASALVVTGLQKRLLSSIEAFANTLEVHMRSVKRQLDADNERPTQLSLSSVRNLLVGGVSADDERADLSEDEVAAEEHHAIEAASAMDESSPAGLAAEWELLNRMAEIANQHRRAHDPRVRHFLDWISRELRPGGTWNDRRVILFTEYTDTKNYLKRCLETTLIEGESDEGRIAVFHGGLGEDRRQELKEAFNADPAQAPLRILIATDAAREGLNLQNHCADLFHFDVPWNPSRLEQRNGRIDRTLQKSPEVRCHYFFFPQRPEDKVLRTLVAKSQRIQRELGSLAPVVESRLSELLSDGMRRKDLARLEADIEGVDQSLDRTAIDGELEGARSADKRLVEQLGRLQALLKDSQAYLNIRQDAFRNALSASLTLLGAPPLSSDPGTPGAWRFPYLDQAHGARWTETMDSLRKPRGPKEDLHRWRKEAPIRPVIFEDPGNLNRDKVHLHLEQPVVQRLLGRFRAQGFVHDDLSRACVLPTHDPIPRVVMLARVALHGEGATRLHDEIFAACGRLDSDGVVHPLSESERQETLRLLTESLADPQVAKLAPQVERRLEAALPAALRVLRPELEERFASEVQRVRGLLVARGDAEAEAMREILKAQESRIKESIRDYDRTRKKVSNPHPAQMRFDYQDLQAKLAQELKQLELDHRYWQARLEALREELKREPERIRRSYEVVLERLDPVAVVYLQPLSS